MSRDKDVPMSETEQAAYDEWLREKVQAAKNDSRPLIPHEEVVEKLIKLLAQRTDAASKPDDCG